MAAETAVADTEVAAAVAIKHPLKNNSEDLCFSPILPNRTAPFFPFTGSSTCHLKNRPALSALRYRQSPTAFRR